MNCAKILCRIWQKSDGGKKMANNYDDYGYENGENGSGLSKKLLIPKM